MTRVFVIGAGGFGKCVVSNLLANGVTPDGVIDADPACHGTDVLGAPVVGGDSFVEALPPGETELYNGLGYVGRSDARMKAFDRFTALGFVFPPLVHPSATLTHDIEYGPGAQVMAGAILNPGVRLGRNTLVNIGVTVGHGVVFKDHACTGTAATIAGDVVLGERVLAGAGSVIIQGVVIGGGSIVAAGATVISDVLPGVTAAGVPAAALRSRK
ncbi:MAG: NeuD/PglB/VioB family sugar acetyltransferase [Rhodospirillales bacterium]